MNIQEFKGRKYDEDKVNSYYKKVDKKVQAIEKGNEKRWERYVQMFKDSKEGLKPHLFHENGFCTFCGAIRPSGEVGVGPGCADLIHKFLKGYIHEFIDIPQKYKDDYLNAYSKYAKYARALYLYNNTKNHDMKTIKAFKNQFKKSFTQSLLDNKEARLSKKQLEVIEKDAEPYSIDCGGYKSYYVDVKKGYKEQLENYRKYVFYKFYYSQGYDEFKEHVFNSIEFGLYARIMVANAWVD